MFPPVFSIAAADGSVMALLGSGTPGDPVRLWAFGEAPRAADGSPAHGTPYAVWQIVTGSPENYLDRTPDVDGHGVQIDCYAESQSAAREVAQALRDCLEPHAHITSWNGELRDFPTGLYRLTFTIAFITPRTES
jgi:hypothetical protein